MAKNTVSDWSVNADQNTDVAGIDLSEGCPAAGLNNALRAIMAQIVAWPVGYRSVPQLSQTAAYSLAATENGKQVKLTTGGVTVPANGTTALDVGYIVTIINDSDTAQAITPASGVMLRQAGTALTGNRSLAGRGLATLLKVGTDEWYTTGAGLA